MYIIRQNHYSATSLICLLCGVTKGYKMGIRNVRKLLVFKIIFLLIMNIVIKVNGHRNCKHIHPREHEVIRDVHIEPAHIIKKRSIDHPLRIVLYYDESVYRLDAEQFELINNTVLPEAVHFWEKALMVRKTGGVIRLNRKCKNNQVFYRVGDPYPYCNLSCEERTMCGEVQVPEDHLEACRTCNALGQDCRVTGSGRGNGIVGADFVFYVSAKDTERCSKVMTVAYAAHCQQEAALDRPIAGHANLCPKSISTKPQELQVLLSTMKHEILHALGFSISLFAFYRDQYGNPLTNRTKLGKPELSERFQTRKWSDKIIRSVVRKDWLVKRGRFEREIFMMVTPRVVKEVRNHFGCPELEGAELEDQGEDGTATTHWEKRVFENEAMTGTHTQNPVYSRITLAMMEDTGWYRANYSMAEPLAWGKNRGCDFVMKSCKEWIDSRLASKKSIHPFCNKVKQDPLETECTDDRNSVALCNLIEYDTKLPLMYQNFDKLANIPPGTEDFYGGSVTLADYCPYIQEFSWRANGVVVRGSHCHFVENSPTVDKNFALESYGLDSKCFDNTAQMWEERSCGQIRQWRHWGSGCYNYLCMDGLLHIVVANYTYTCYKTGQVLGISIMSDGWLHRGGLICPSCEEICNKNVEDGRPPFVCNASGTIPFDITFPRDELRCGSWTLISLSLVSLLFLAASIVRCS